MKAFKITVFWCVIFTIFSMQAMEQPIAKKTKCEVLAMLKRADLDTNIRQIYGQTVEPERKVYETLEATAGTVRMKSILYTNGDSDLSMPCLDKGYCRVLRFKKATGETVEEFYSYNRRIHKLS
jgi:hypothetical protein